jgi:hypothetical protein
VWSAHFAPRPGDWGCVPRAKGTVDDLPPADLPPGVDRETTRDQIARVPGSLGGALLIIRRVVVAAPGAQPFGGMSASVASRVEMSTITETVATKPPSDTTAPVQSMSVRATCNQSLSNAAPSIVHIAQRAMAPHKERGPGSEPLYHHLEHRALVERGSSAIVAEGTYSPRRRRPQSFPFLATMCGHGCPYQARWDRVLVVRSSRSSLASASAWQGFSGRVCRKNDEHALRPCVPRAAQPRAFMAVARLDQLPIFVIGVIAADRTTARTRGCRRDLRFRCRPHIQEIDLPAPGRGLVGRMRVAPLRIPAGRSSRPFGAVPG